MTGRARSWGRRTGVGAAAPARGEDFQRMAVLTVVANKDYLPLVRTSAMQVAALLELPLPQVIDLRLAVDEACTSFLAQAPRPQSEPGAAARATLCLCYDRCVDRLRVTVRGPAPALWPARDELGWVLLCAVAGEVHAEVVDGVGTLTLVDPLRRGA